MALLRFGTAVRDITPALPAQLHGYADRDHLSDGVAERLQLGCLALDDGDTTLLIITCDMIGIEVDVCQELYALLEKETGVAYPQILLSCSHTHFAPALHAGVFNSPTRGEVEPDSGFVDAFRTKIVEAARESLANLRPGHLETVRRDAPQMLFNRRTLMPDGSVQTNFRYPPDAENYTFSPTDPEITVLRICEETGIGVALINFGCHPVTGGEVAARDHYRVSADYPYYARQAIADAWACPVFFTLGAAGDAVPIDRYGNSRQRLGGILGQTTILAERVFQEEESVTLDAEALELEARTILTTDASTAADEFTQARHEYSELLAAGEVAADSPAVTAASERYNQAGRAYHRSRLYPDNEYRIPIQTLRIGSTVLVSLPFEVLSEISLRMKERFPHSVLVSCAGGYQGYLPPEHEYPRGGYEASERSTHFEPGTADRVLELVLDWLERDRGPVEQSAT